jgi:luciferase-like monooxygenase/metallo-beta-lactamase superfamily protein
MSKSGTASRQITEEVGSWPGVEAGPGRRGGFAFKVGRREIGHLHGDRAAHFSFPKAVWAELRKQGRIVPHPVFPDSEGPAARTIEDDADMRDVIELLRLNYDRAVATHGLPGNGDVAIEGVYASTPAALPFDSSLHIRAFLLQREQGNLLVYSAPGLEADAAEIEERGGISRQYLNHGHEAMFASRWVTAPLFVHEHDEPSVAAKTRVSGTFSERHMVDDDFEVIPTPGHTTGATTFLWDSGRHRFLFTGDTIYLRDGEWTAAVLGSSDRALYIESFELIRELDFDVLVPWAATGGQPWYAETGSPDARLRIDAILQGLRHE